MIRLPLAAICILLLPTLTGARVLPGADVTVAKLSQTITDQRNRVQSMRGTFTFETTPDQEAQTNQLMGGLKPKANVAFAWSGNKRLIIDSGEFITRDDMKAHPDSSKNLYNGSEFRRREGKVFLIQEARSSYADLNAYLYSLYWPMSPDQVDEAQKAPNKTMSLPYCLKGEGWRVRPERDIVAGVPCVVVEKPAVQWQYYFDPGRGYCLIRAEFARPTPRTPRLVVNYSDFREVLPRLYLPMEVVAEAQKEDSDGKPLGTLTTRIIVQELRCNEVPDNIFVLEPEVGDYVIDKIRNQTYNYNRTDESTLDVVSQEAAQKVASARRASLTYRAAGFLLALCVGALGVYATARIRRYLRRARMTISP